MNPWWPADRDAAIVHGPRSTKKTRITSMIMRWRTWPLVALRRGIADDVLRSAPGWSAPRFSISLAPGRNPAPPRPRKAGNKCGHRRGCRPTSKRQARAPGLCEPSWRDNHRRGEPGGSLHAQAGAGGTSTGLGPLQPTGISFRDAKPQGWRRRPDIVAWRTGKQGLKNRSPGDERDCALGDVATSING